MPRVLLTGNHSLVRSALKTLLSVIGGVSVAGECANDADAISAAVRSLRPDVVVMDCDLGPATPAAALTALLRAAKGSAVLIVTAVEHRATITCALQQGVLGVISKDRSAETLVRAIRAVASGETWLERSVVTQMLRTDVEKAVSTTHEKLTRREHEVVALVSLGLQNKKIAERLFISETTVRHHLTSIYDKLAVNNRLELMRYAYAEGGLSEAS
jgi:DNA-binding NarL/FixJ family response regulator